jgi:TRAP-type C4-dicarboxylate transport system permease small subunit
MKKALGVLEKGIECIGGFMVLAMTIIVLVQVIARFIFNSPFTWTEELARYIFVYITFLGGGLLVYQRTHLFVEVIFNNLHPTMRKYVQIAIDLIVAVFSAFLIRSAYSLIGTSSTHHSTGVGLPMSYVSLSVLMGGVLMFVFSLYNIYLDVNKVTGIKIREDSEGGSNV